MPSKYVHLSGRDVDQALLRLNNIAVSEKESRTENSTLKTCPRCRFSNPPANRFCSRCGIVLDEKMATELMRSNMDRRYADDIMDKLVQDSEFRAVLELKLRELTKRESAAVGSY